VGRVGTNGASVNKVETLENRDSTAWASLRCSGFFDASARVVLPKTGNSAQAGDSLFPSVSALSQLAPLVSTSPTLRERLLGNTQQ